MKKQLIAVLVGSLILFIWQFLSWAMLNLHGSQMQYTPNNEVIMSTLNEHLKTGDYMLPNLPPTATDEERENYGAVMDGKPWARVSYHESFRNSMGMNMFRAWIINLLAVWLLCWVLLKMANLNFSTTILTCLAVGLIGYLTINYLNSIWFSVGTLPDLMDAVVQWGLCGAWLGWWLPRD